MKRFKIVHITCLDFPDLIWVKKRVEHIYRIIEAKKYRDMVIKSTTLDEAKFYLKKEIEKDDTEVITDLLDSIYSKSELERYLEENKELRIKLQDNQSGSKVFLLLLLSTILLLASTLHFFSNSPDTTSINPIKTQKILPTAFQDTFIDSNRKSPKLIVVHPGTYQTDTGNSIKVDGFAITQYEITFAEYNYFCEQEGRQKSNNGNLKLDEKHPVINISFFDAKAYAKWLSQKTGEAYRLPTLLEWQYSAQSGSKTLYWWGDHIGYNRANCKQCSSWDAKGPTPTGSYLPNHFGIYDTAGNVWEWVSIDTYKQMYVYGGGWRSEPKDISSFSKKPMASYSKSDDIGFRLVREL